MKSLIGKKTLALVGVFSEHCETSWRFGDSSNVQTELYSSHTLATTATSGPFIPNLDKYNTIEAIFSKNDRWLPSQSISKVKKKMKLSRGPRAAPARHSPLPAKILTNKTAFHCIRLHNTKYIYISISICSKHPYNTELNSLDLR